jgi:Xaa-Pro dipeptidase
MGVMVFEMPVDLAWVRQDRLRSVMRETGVGAVLTADPINIVYGCGVRNMSVFGMMGPSRFLLLFANGPSVLYEFAGSEHLAKPVLRGCVDQGLATVDEVRSAPGITPNSGPSYSSAASRFADEIRALCALHLDAGSCLAVERVDFEFTDLLRGCGLGLANGTETFLQARRCKQPAELVVMREGVRRVEAGMGSMERSLKAGVTEVELWALLHHDLIASNGEYISTRLAQSGPRTFPYFQEASDRVVADGDLFCLDTDALGLGGYAVDLSRTFLCGDVDPTPTQRRLYRRAYDQLLHNGSLLAPGRSYEQIARKAWPIPEEHQPFGYYCVLHGLGLSGEHPYVPLAAVDQPYDFPGELEPGMVVCCESYIGDEQSGQGVKLEDQFLITESGVERLTNYPFDNRMLA